MKQKPQFRGMGILLIVSIVLLIMSTMIQKNLFGESLSYQEFMVAVENKTIHEIQIEQNQQTPTGVLYITLADNTGATMAVSDVVEIEKILRENEIKYYLTDVPQQDGFRAVVAELMEAGVIRGDGGSPAVIDLSRDMVRLLVMLHRAGVFDNIREKNNNKEKTN